MLGFFGFSMAVGLTATVTDLRNRTIPNWLSLTALLVGLAARTYLYGWSGAADAGLGVLIGFAVFLVFFLLGGMGGGDVKLMAAFGAILGREQILTAAIWTALAGGLMALGYLAFKKLRRAVKKERRAEDELDRKDSMPYAPAILMGVLMSFLSEEELWTSVC